MREFWEGRRFFLWAPEGMGVAAMMLEAIGFTRREGVLRSPCGVPVRHSIKEMLDRESMRSAMDSCLVPPILLVHIDDSDRADIDESAQRALVRMMEYVSNGRMQVMSVNAAIRDAPPPVLPERLGHEPEEPSEPAPRYTYVPPVARQAPSNTAVHDNLLVELARITQRQIEASERQTEVMEQLRDTMVHLGAELKNVNTNPIVSGQFLRTTVY